MDGGRRRRQRRSTRFAGATARPRPRIAGRPSPRLEADARGSSQPRPVIHGNAAERAELAGAATPLQSSAASTPAVRPSELRCCPTPPAPRLSLSAAVPLSFLPSVAILRLGGGIHSCRLKVPHGNITPARPPSNLAEYDEGGGRIACPSVGRKEQAERARGKKVRRIRTLPWESESGTLAANRKK